MSLTAHITGLGVDHADGSFTINYDVLNEDGSIVAAHQQGFPSGTDRATVDEAVSNYMRDVVPVLMSGPPIAIGDQIAAE
jgi:hypothetical protein